MHQNQISRSDSHEEGDEECEDDECPWRQPHLCNRLGREVHPSGRDYTVSSDTRYDCSQCSEPLSLGIPPESCIQRALCCCGPQHRILWNVIVEIKHQFLIISDNLEQADYISESIQ